MSRFDESGLTIDTLQEIITALEDGYKLIYGNDIVVGSNSVDGQQINIYAQSKRDSLEILAQINAGFNLEQAIGIVLDQRVALLNIERQGSTFTQQQVEITTDRALTLAGLDADATDPDGTGYTVADDAGTQFILLDTFNVPGSGTYNLTFRAKDSGSITTLPNTITNPVTVVLGVTNINNPTGALEVGLDGELDAPLRLRAAKSSANNSTGAGMKGVVEVDITTVNSSLFTAKFDRPASKSLWIRFDIKATIMGQTFDETAIKQYLTDNLDFTIGESAETSTITTTAQAAIDTNGGGGVPLNVEISDDGVTYVDFLTTDTLDQKWIVDNARIIITLI